MPSEPQESAATTPAQAPMELDALFGRSPSLQHLLPGLRRAARVDSPVLILGEPGSGRSTLARALHLASPRAERDLVEVDAGALPAGLVESDLFGHAAGAFTGANEDRSGHVARAEGGSLLLDRVEELPRQVQPKLLRLLAERCYAPLGDHRERRADVRFLALGPEDLGRRVSEGSFREDLYYRLEVLAFRLPPLRERLADLKGLAQAMLEDLARRFERPCPGLSPDALTWMQEHAWPGNLRELRNVLERAMISSDAAQLDPPPVDGLAATPPSLAQVEEQAIRHALAFARGHQGRAAEILGISRKALWAKRRRLGIP